MFNYLDKLIRKCFSIFSKSKKDGEWYKVTELYINSKTGQLHVKYDDTITEK